MATTQFVTDLGTTGPVFAAIAKTDLPAIIVQTEIDFGATPVADGTFTITDANVTASSKILCSLSYDAPTSKDQDEIEMDDLVLNAAAGSGQFTLYARAIDGSYLADKFKINYMAV